MRNLIYILSLSTGSMACTNTTTGDSSEPVLPFCEKMEDANSYVVEDGSDSTTSGTVEGRIITDESDDLHDPQWVGFLDYTVDNTDVGGTQQQGETSQDGSFIEVLGEGHWNFKISATQAGYSCSNELEFLVEAGGTTQVCVDVNCI
jgi:hypothetical protein